MSAQRHFLTLVCLLSACLLTAGPARRTPLTFTQPDGTTFQARVRGDEFLHIITDLDGHALVRDGDGFWCYAYYNADGTRVSSGHPVGGKVPGHVLSASSVIPYAALSLRSRARRQDAAAVTLQNRTLLQRIRRKTADGAPEETVNKHSIVILAEFKDVPMTYTQEDFIDMLTKEGYNRNGAEGSAMDYFDGMFLGDYHFEFTVAPVVTLSKPISHYFANEDGQDRNPAQAIAEACRKAHEEHGIDFSKFDDDGDGTVDNVIVFVAGKDEAEHPDEEEWVWSHAWSLRSAGISCVLDGKRIDSYAVTSEIRRDEAGKDTFAGIGTFCHEFSHTFGLPDLYDTDYEGSGGMANGMFLSLDLMDAGNYNGGGKLPPHYSALDYHLLGLGLCEEIGPGTYTLEPISAGRRYLKYETGNDGEYFLFECRDDSAGWDRGIGGKGLLVYHIDQSSNPAGISDLAGGIVLTAQERWSPALNQVNANPDHECARLITATPGIRAYTSEGYDSGNQARVFYPQNSNKSFTPQTDPPFVTWAGKEASLSVVNIAFSENGAVSFTVLDNREGQIPRITGSKTEIFQDGAILRWAASDPGFSGMAVVEWGASPFSVMDTVEVRPYAAGLYALVLENLTARTPYRAEIHFERDGVAGESETVSFLTKSFPDNGIAYIVLPAAQEGGTFAAGTEIPLHVSNARNVEHVEWTLNGQNIATGPDGYYTLTKSGTLKAAVTRKDGSKDFIIKELIVK